MDKISGLFSPALRNALKEALRLVVLAIIPIVLLGIDSGTGAVAINWALVQVTALITALRFIDKLMHESGKAKQIETKKPSKLTLGLTRF